MLCAEPKERKHFRPATRPGGFGYPAGRIGDQGDREIVYVPNVYVPFRPLLVTEGHQKPHLAHTVQVTYMDGVDARTEDLRRKLHETAESQA